MSFAENLRAVRKVKNLSQEDLADLLGVSRQAVSKWELGEGYPEAEKLLTISRELNVSLDNLMGSEMINKKTDQRNISGHILISSPHEGILVNCTTVMKSQRFKGGKSSPKYALIAHEQNENTLSGPTNTFLGWYMTEESILQEIAEIRQAMTKGEADYELKYSVKCRKSFLSVTLEK